MKINTTNLSKVIIISGSPCAGKTTLAEKIAKIFKLPIISSDPIREYLFNIFVCKNLLMFKKNRKMSFSLMFFIIELMLKNSQSFIVDSSFQSRENRQKIKNLQKKFKFDCFQINLTAEGKTLWSRYLARIRSGKRHIGYLYHLRMKQIEKQAKGGAPTPPKIHGKLLKLDTTDFVRIDYKNIFRQIKTFLISSE